MNISIYIYIHICLHVSADYYPDNSDADDLEIPPEQLQAEQDATLEEPVLDNTAQENNAVVNQESDTIDVFLNTGDDRANARIHVEEITGSISKLSGRGGVKVGSPEAAHTGVYRLYRMINILNDMMTYNVMICDTINNCYFLFQVMEKHPRRSPVESVPGGRGKQGQLQVMARMGTEHPPRSHVASLRLAK